MPAVRNISWAGSKILSQRDREREGGGRERKKEREREREGEGGRERESERGGGTLTSLRIWPQYNNTDTTSKIRCELNPHRLTRSDEH